jgi:pyridoxal/pyridoxine/pyridoxamine kinase
MNSPTKSPAPPAPEPTAGERVWRNTFFVLSSTLAGLALVQFDAGRIANGLGDLGASVLMLSLISQFPFIRAVIRASADSEGSQEQSKRRQEELMQQAAQLKAAHPWSDMAGRAGWVLLGVSLVLRLAGGS